MPIGPTQPQTYANYLVNNARFPAEGPKAVPVPLDFSAQQSYNVDLSQLQALHYMNSVQSVFVDNSLNTLPLTIVPTDTNQNLIVPGSSQAILPLFNNTMKFTVTCQGAQRAVIFFSNIPMPAEVWSTTGNFNFDINGYLKTSDVALDALITGGALQVTPNGTENNNVVKPIFFADELFTGSASTTTAQTIITGAPSFFITEVFVAVSGGANLAVAGEFSVLLKDDATTIAQGKVFLNNAAPLVDQAPFELIVMRNLQYNSKASTKLLTLTASANLSAGIFYWNIAGGLCSNIGP